MPLSVLAYFFILDSYLCNYNLSTCPYSLSKNYFCCNFEEWINADDVKTTSCFHVNTMKFRLAVGSFKRKTYRGTRSQVFYENLLWKKTHKIHGKTLCQGFYLINLKVFSLQRYLRKDFHTGVSLLIFWDFWK